MISLASIRRTWVEQSAVSRLRTGQGLLFAALVILSGAGLWALRQPAGSGSLAMTVFSVVSTVTIGLGIWLLWAGAAAVQRPAEMGAAASKPQAARRPEPAAASADDGFDDFAPRTVTAPADKPEPVAVVRRPFEVQPRSAVSPTVSKGNPVVHDAVAVAERGSEVVVRVVQNLEDISASSRKINEIVATIDSIAFQTNILALNAAVQAARARQQGEGTVTVAAEVRSLAQRAASAAREIRSLVNQSVDKVEAGNRLVRDAGATMEAIVSSVQSVTEIMGRVGDGGESSGEALAQVSQTVMQLGRLADHNESLVEESATAADALREQAERLQKVVSAFKLLQQTQEAAWAAHSAISGARLSSRFGGLSGPSDSSGDSGAQGRNGDWERF